MSREKLDLLFSILDVCGMGYGRKEYPDIDKKDIDLMQSILKFIDNSIKSHLKEEKYKTIKKKDFSTIAVFCNFMENEHKIKFNKSELEKINQSLR